MGGKTANNRKDTANTVRENELVNIVEQTLQIWWERSRMFGGKGIGECLAGGKVDNDRKGSGECLKGREGKNV